MKLFAQGENIKDLFGEVQPPKGMDFGKGSNPAQGLANFIGFGINIFIVVAGFFMFLNLLWGAFDWINSGGEKEKLIKAQNKITNAVIGIVLVFAMLVGFNLLAGQILGIITPTEKGFQINLPKLQ